MESAKGPLGIDTDFQHASQTAEHIIYSMLDRFIAPVCRGEAYEHVAEIFHKEGLELTSKVMRKEYEVWKSLQLKGLEVSSPSVKPGS